jgi:hypothetical protein
MTRYQDQALKSLLIGSAHVVTPSDTLDLPSPGVLFLDNSGTEGNVKADLVEGGTITFALSKTIRNYFLVSRVWATGTAAVGILIDTL